jgi:hypothetical protein
MMRVLFLVLLLLNLLAFAFSRGWLGTPTPEGEPERLTNQLNPERIVLRPAEAPRAEEAKPKPPEPAAAPEPSPAPVAAPANEAKAPAAKAANGQDEACVALTGLTEAQADSLAQNLRAATAAVRATHETGTAPSSWWVHIPANGGKEAAERRVAELRSLGIEDLFIMQDPGPNQYAVSLGLFKSEAKAQQHLAMLQNKRVRTAAIAARNTVVHRVEMRGSAAAVDTMSASRVVRQSGATIGECKP